MTASTPPSPCHPVQEGAITSSVVIPSPPRNLCSTQAKMPVQYTDPSIASLQRDDKGNRMPLVCLLLLLILPGCGLLGKSGPEEVRLSVEVANGQEVRMITSTRFLTTRVEEIEDNGNIADSLAILLLDADTSFILSSFDSLYDISFEQQFYVRLIRSSPQGDNLTTRVWVDDDLKFMSQPADPRDSLQFIYNFRGPIGQDNTDL